MQGRVWGGLMCTTTMDKLCKLVYEDEKVLYRYRGIVAVPPLEMVDDVITVSKCGSTSIALNQIVNTFIDLKKLKLSEGKCSKIHIGKKINPCPEHRVDQREMKTAVKEKYLEDFVTEKANSKDTIEDRKLRGNAMLSLMSALLSDIPLGKWRTETGITLRQSWFINGCIFNSEVWSGFSPQDLHDLQVIDHKILRLITGAHICEKTTLFTQHT